MAREQGRLCLRLTVSAHGAIGHETSVAELRKCRIECVQRTPTRLECVDGIGGKRKARTPVLHEHAGGRKHDARSEFPIERLDIGNTEPGRVCSAHPYRINWT